MEIVLMDKALKRNAEERANRTTLSVVEEGR
jgi:hypothetical protein